MKKFFGLFIGSIFIIFCLIAIMTNSVFARTLSIKAVYDAVLNIPSATIYQMLSAESNYFKVIDGAPKAEIASVKQIFQMATNIVISDHRSLLGNELPGFRFFDSKILVAGDGTNYTNMPIESPPPDEYLTNTLPPIENNDNAQVSPPAENEIKTNGEVVYIYSTHSREEYAPQKTVTETGEEKETKITVMNAGDSLVNFLGAVGIGARYDHADVIGRLLEKKAPYARAYDESRPLIEEAFAKNSQLKYVIDVHRDSQPKNITTLEKDGLTYAKVAFVVGGENANYEHNAKLANALHDKLNTLLPKVSRGIFLKSGQGNNGVYNQDLSKNAILLEVGGTENTLDEINRTLAVFAEAFNQYYWENLER